MLPWGSDLGWLDWDYEETWLWETIEREFDVCKRVAENRQQGKASSDGKPNPMSAMNLPDLLKSLPRSQLPADFSPK